MDTLVDSDSWNSQTRKPVKSHLITELVPDYFICVIPVSPRMITNVKTNISE